MIVSYLDGIEAAEIAEIIGASAGAVAMQVHRIKRLLARHFQIRINELTRLED